MRAVILSHALTSGGKVARDLLLLGAACALELLPAPTAGAASRQIAVEGTVSADTVRVEVNDAPAALTAGSPVRFSAAVTIQEGPNTIVVRAVDTANNAATSNMQVTLDTTGPAVSITMPTAQPTHITSMTPVSLGGTASDASGVTEVTWGSDLGGSGTASGTDSWNAAGIGLQNGDNLLTVTARDAAGNTGADSLTVTYAPPGDLTAPAASLTAPASGATVSGTITVSAVASDDVGVAGMQFLLDGMNLGAEDTTSSYSVSWNTTQTASGAHTLSVRARDAAGNQATSAALTVMVDQGGGGGAGGPVRFVDGACQASGNGTSLVCGAAGPYRTIGEGIQALQPGETLNIRGAHDGFDGVYFEELYLDDPVPAGLGAGGAVACTVGARCAIQGCRAPACPADEVPTVRGMRLRNDWTDRGSGVYSRVMEATPHRNVIAERPDASGPYDPQFLVQHDDSLAYSTDSDNDATPADGAWSFHPSSNEVYVNPTGTADPATSVYVPHFNYGVYASAPTAYVTFRHFTVEGVRTEGLDLGDPGNGGTPGLILSRLTVRHFKRFAVHAHTTENLLIEDSIFEHGCRGGSWYLSTGDGCWGLRLFAGHGGVARRNIARHLGSTGTMRFSNPAAQPWGCSWCDAPWNSRTHTYSSATGIGYQIKQTAGFTLAENQAYDIQSGGIGLDVSRDVLVEGNMIYQAGTGIGTRNFTPVSGYQYNSDHTIRNNVLRDVGINEANLCAISINGNDATARHAGETRLADVYNNVIVRPGFAGICVNGEETSPGDVLIANNAIYGVRSTPDANQPSRGIIVRAASSNVQIRNNIIDGTTGEGLVIASAAMAGASFDGELFGTNGLCQIRWNASVNSANISGGTCDTLTVFRLANPLQEAQGRTGAPGFISGTDLHLGPGSAAIDAGVTLSTFGTDMDGEARPQGGGWDIGADEVP